VDGHTERHFDEDLGALKERLMVMGGLCERMIMASTKGLVQRDLSESADVFANEHLVNQLHLEIDDRCVKLFALRTPVAGDLRAIMAAMKINNELERIGDQAVNITQNTAEVLKHPQLKALTDIPNMSAISISMLKDSLDAYVRRDPELAAAVLQRDDSVDRMKSVLFKEMLAFMIAETTAIPQALDLILIARNLERVADHATNIAEDVIFMVKGKDIRHASGAPASLEGGSGH
jgi:phosphate transport system protein